MDTPRLRLLPLAFLLLMLQGMGFPATLECWFDPVYQEPLPGMLDSNLRDVWCNLTNSSGHPILNANISHSTFDTNDWYNTGLMGTKGWFLGYHLIPNAYNLSDVNLSVTGTKRIDSSTRAQLSYGPFFYPFPHISQTFSLMAKAGSGASELRVMVCNYSYAEKVFGHTPVNLSRANDSADCQLAGTINATEQGANPFNWTWVSLDITEAYNDITRHQAGVATYSIHIASDDEFAVNPVGWEIDSRWMPPYHNETKEAYSLHSGHFYAPDESELPPGCGYSKGINKSGNVLHFRFNEDQGPLVTDYSCEGNNGEAYDQPAFNQTGKFNKSIDMTSDRRSRVVVQHNPTLNLIEGGTLMAWVYLQENSPYGGLFHKGQKADFSDEAYALQFLDNGNELSLYMRNSSGGTDQLTTSATLSLETWHHVAATWNGTSWVIYIDGEQQASKTSHITPRETPGSLQVGAQLNESHSSTYRMLSFNGKMDEAMAFSRALSAAEIRVHYFKGRSHFLPDDRVHNTSSETFWEEGNLLTAPDTVELNSTTGFAHFSQDSDYLEFLNLSSFNEARHGEFTACLFFRHDNYVGTQKYWTCGDSMELLYIDGMFRLAVRREGQSWSTLDSPLGLDAASDGEWHHLCGIRDVENEELRIILDGETVASMPFSSSYSLREAHQCVMGRDVGAGGSDEWFRGQLAHFFFHNDSHGEAEIAEGINSAFWQIAIGQQAANKVYASGRLANQTHILWENEPIFTPISFTKIYDMNNESAYMSYNETEQLYHYTYYTNQPELLASQGAEGVNFTTLFDYEGKANTTSYWHVKGETNATCTVSIEWNTPSREGQYQLARINFSSNSTLPLVERKVHICEGGNFFPGECTTYTAFGDTFHHQPKEFGTATAYCEVMTSPMEEAYIANSTIEVGCWSPYGDYDGTKDPLVMLSDLYICPGFHTAISKAGGDYAVLRNNGDHKLFLLGPTTIDGGGVHYQGEGGAWNQLYWAYDLHNRVFDTKGMLIVQNTEIAFFTDTIVENFAIANVKFINVSIPFSLEHSTATNFTITNNTFTNCGINGEDSIYVSGPNVRIVHNYFNTLHPGADKNVYCDGCSNVTLEQNHYWDIDGLKIYSLGNNRTTSTPLGDFTCEVGETGSQHPYANYESINESHLNGARLYGHIKDEYPCTANKPPLIEIVSPLNTTYSSQTLHVEILNFSAFEVWYNWDGANITYSGPANITFAEGTNVLHAWGNNTEGTEHYENVTFTIDSSLSIGFVPPTEPNGSVISQNFTLVNASYSSGSDASGFIDFGGDLVGYWNFEYHTSTVVYDNSTYGNQAELVNGAFVNGDTAHGVRGNFLSLNGVNRFARSSYEPELDVLGEFTIEAWVNEGSQNRDWAQILNRDRDNGFNLQHDRYNTVFEFAVRTTSGRSWIQAGPPGGIQEGAWYHVAGVYNGTNIILYIDGVQRAIGDRSGDMLQSTSPLFIGARGAATGGQDRHFNGSIDEVRFWNRALTPDEINSSYKLNQGHFHSFYTSLEEGEYEFRGCVIDKKGEFICTQTRTVIFSETGNCPVLSSPGTYSQKEHYSGAPNSAQPGGWSACVKIISPDVVFDCNGFNITNNGTGNAHGIFFEEALSNITMLNCPSISGYSTGVYLKDSGGANISNSTLHHNIIGIRMENSSGNSLYGNTLHSNSGHALYFDSSSGNTLSETLLYGQESSFFSSNSSGISISNFTVQNGSSRITFFSISDGETHLGDSNLIVEEDFVSLDSSAVPHFNTSARVTISTNSCPPTLYTKEGYPTTYQEIISGGTVCTSCSIVSCGGGLVTFDVPHFSGYASGTNSNLTIYNDGPAVEGAVINFTAIYLNISDASHIAGATCTLGLQNGSTYPMGEFATYYESNITAFVPGTHNYNVTCSAAGFDTLTAFDTYQVLGGAPNATITVYAANVTIINTSKYFSNLTAGNITTEGGNISAVNLNSSRSTEKWAGFYGNTTGSLILSEHNASVFMYKWAWDSTLGGTVCVSTNSTLYTFQAAGASASEIGTAWGFSPTDTDSAENTYNGTGCTINFGQANVSGASYAQTGTSGDFRTCALRSAISPSKPEMLFCANITSAGQLFNGRPGDFELIAPTAQEPGAFETYYFYMSLD